MATINTSGTLSSAGLGSGLDVNSLVTKLMAVENQPITVITNKETKIQTKISTFGTLKSALTTLQTAAKAISTPAQLAPLSTSVADTTILSASADPNNGAIAGTHNIEVQSLAAAQKLVSSTSFTDTTSALGLEGASVTFNFGTYSTSGPSTFTPNASKSAQSITLTSSNNSLAGLRDAINSANFGLSADILNTGTGYVLSLTSSDSGARNAMQISVSDASLNALTYDQTGGTSNMTQSVAAQDAVIKVDTVTIASQTNTISDAIQGVTLNLTKQSALNVTTALTVSRSTTGVQAALQSFVDAYNGVQAAIATATAYDTATGKASALTGDSTVRSIQTQLRTMLTTPIVGAPAGSSTLTDIGINLQRDGTLAIDSSKLTAALANPAKSFTALFASSGFNKGYGVLMNNLLGQITSPVGLLGTKTKSLNSSIADLEKQRTVISARLTTIEARYRKQFTALDTLISSMTTTTSFLTQQFAYLSKNSSISNS